MIIKDIQNTLRDSFVNRDGKKVKISEILNDNAIEYVDTTPYMKTRTMIFLYKKGGFTARSAIYRKLKKAYSDFYDKDTSRALQELENEEPQLIVKRQNGMILYSHARLGEKEAKNLSEDIKWFDNL